MQWLSSGKSEDPAAFWKEVEARRGGPVRFVTFATVLWRTGGPRLELPGLLYVVGGTAWFEDMEKDNWFVRLLASRRRESRRTEISFALAEVAAVRPVARRRAAQCVAGTLAPAAAPVPSGLSRLLSSPLTLVLMRDGTAFIADVLKREGFAALVAEAAAGTAGA